VGRLIGVLSTASGRGPRVGSRVKGSSCQWILHLCSAPAVQGSPGGPGNTGGGGSAPGFPNMFWILILGMLAVIVMSSLSGRKQEKQRRALLSAVKRGDKVQTSGGVLGTVVELTDHEMVLRVDEASNTRIRFTRAALQQVLRESKEGPKGDVEAKPRSEAASLK
jgi:preprotein translocase subunit YajC